jgi:D-proline reductase (dithiol) PrdB
MPLDYLRFMNQNRAKGPRRIVSSHRGDSWTPFTRSLASARLALITSAAVRHVNQPVFEPPGDTSYRQVASDTPASDLRIDHRSPVGTDARVDLEIVLPRAALEELARSGVVGSVAPSFLSFAGGTELHQQLDEELAPALANELQTLGVDLALLVPY